MTLETIKSLNEGLIQNGYIVVADTIEELAEGFGLPAETLKKTVERQNENYDAGKLKASLVGSQRRFFVRLFRQKTPELSTNKSSFPFRRTPQAKTLFARPYNNAPHT